MSTDIGTVPDALDANFELQVYTGSGGVCLFARSSLDRGLKIWLDDAGVDQLIELLQIVQRSKQ